MADCFKDYPITKDPGDKEFYVKLRSGDHFNVRWIEKMPWTDTFKPMTDAEAEGYDSNPNK